MREDLNAVVLAGAIEMSPLAPVEPVVAAPPVRRFIRATRAPLDLDADVFRYRVLADSTIIALRARRGARTCREPHHRHLD